MIGDGSEEGRNDAEDEALCIIIEDPDTFKIATEFYALASVDRADSEDKKKHDSKAIVAAWTRALRQLDPGNCGIGSGGGDGGGGGGGGGAGGGDGGGGDGDGGGGGGGHSRSRSRAAGRGASYGSGRQGSKVGEFDSGLVDSDDGSVSPADPDSEDSAEENDEREKTDIWKKMLTTAGLDGASVNMGERKGIKGRMVKLINWFLARHCGGHNLQLAVLDSVEGEEGLEDLESMLKALYSRYSTAKQMGSLRDSSSMYEALEEFDHVIKFVGIHGIRWMASKKRALQAFIHNLPAAVADLNYHALNSVGAQFNLCTDPGDLIGLKVDVPFAPGTLNIDKKSGALTGFKRKKTHSYVGEVIIFN